MIDKRVKLAKNNPHSKLHQFVDDPAHITTDVVLQAFKAGDGALREVIIEVGRHLGTIVASLVGTLNIEHILIAGTVARFGELLLNTIREEMQQRAMQILAHRTQIGLSSLGQDIVVQGAAALLLSNELGVV